MYIVKYSERVHMARMHELASESPPYTLKIAILRLIILLSRISKTIRPFILP